MNKPAILGDRRQTVDTTDAPDSIDRQRAAANLDGISLIDGSNRKRHLVARDSTGRCVCDSGLDGTFVEAEAPVVLSATFAAPPPDVEAMDVQIPSFGTFGDVPLS